MRILTVSHFFSTHGGGIEIVAGHLCAEWQAAGEIVVWAACDADASPDLICIEAVPLRSFNFVERVTGLPMPILTLSAIQALWRSVRASDVMVIHDSLYMTSVVSMLAARCAHKPTILIQHTAEAAFSNVLLRLVMKCATVLVTKPMLRAAEHVIFISATTRDFFAHVATKVPPVLTFNGVDGKIFNFSKSAPSSRSVFGIPENNTLCTFVGRFVQNKGLEILHELAKLRPDVHFALAGRGPINPVLWGLSNVTVCGHLPQSSLASLYRAADVFLLPSEREGYPLVIQEAMACGLPVICGEESAKADPGASPWLTGVPVALDNPLNSARLISAAIDGLQMDLDRRAAMAAYASDTYCWKKMADQVLSLQGPKHC